ERHPIPRDDQAPGRGPLVRRGAKELDNGRCRTDQLVHQALGRGRIMVFVTTRKNSGGTTQAKRPASQGAGSERREYLVKLAAERFARKGFQATTVRQIAQEAGILSGRLYHHFGSKEAIVDEVLSTFLDDVTARYRAAVEAGSDPRTVLNEMV